MSNLLFRFLVCASIAFFVSPFEAQAQKTKSKAKKPVAQTIEPQVKTASTPTPKIVPSELEESVLTEINSARREPQKFIAYLEEYKKTAAGKSFVLPSRMKIITIEDAADLLADTIGDLKKMSAAEPLNFSDGLLKVARNHYADIKDNFSLGHTGRDGSNLEKRMQKIGEAGRDVAENLSYGAATAREVVLAWIIDDGIKSRAHRKVVFNRNFKLFGVACGKNSKNESICVAEFAGNFIESKTPARVIRVQ
jgi:uncharacterized protein YkwD